MKKIVTTILFAAAILLVAVSAQAVCDNPIVNGDFESGNADFTTDYSYIAPSPNVLTAPGTYTVDTSPAKVHNVECHNKGI